MNDTNPQEFITRAQLRAKKKKKPKGILLTLGKIMLSLVLVVLLGGVFYGAKMLIDTNNLLNASYKPRANSYENEQIDVMKEPISVLVLGVDNNEERGLETTRTDSMLLLSVNPDDAVISMTSIPRDTYTYIETEAFMGYDKINAAYAYGGVDASIQAVEELLAVPINYYLTLDFQAFENIVDALDGIEIDVPFDLKEMNAQDKVTVNLKKGKQTLDGEEALAFARTRKIDNDIERGGRQQQVVQAVAKKAMQIGTISKYKSILQALDGHIETDMPMGDILSLASSALTKSYTFDSYMFSWMSFDYYGYGETVSMVGLHEDSLAYISHKFRVSLGLDEKDERDEPGYEFVSNGLVSPKTYPQDGMVIENY